jgi:hypothetical protein
MQMGAEQLGLPGNLPFKLDVPKLKSLLMASQQKENIPHPPAPRPPLARRNLRNHNGQAGRRDPAAPAAPAAPTADGKFSFESFCLYSPIPSLPIVHLSPILHRLSSNFSRALCRGADAALGQPRAPPAPRPAQAPPPPPRRSRTGRRAPAASGGRGLAERARPAARSRLARGGRRGRRRGGDGEGRGGAGGRGWLAAHRVPRGAAARDVLPQGTLVRAWAGEGGGPALRRGELVT